MCTAAYSTAQTDTAPKALREQMLEMALEASR